VTFVELSLVTTLPFASSTETATAGVMVAPALVFVGCCVKTSCVAVPGVTLKALLVAEVYGWPPLAPVVSVALSV
jgi:hypothetical protein